MLGAFNLGSACTPPYLDAELHLHEVRNFSVLKHPISLIVKTTLNGIRCVFGCMNLLLLAKVTCINLVIIDRFMSVNLVNVLNYPKNTVSKK